MSDSGYEPTRVDQPAVAPGAGGPVGPGGPPPGPPGEPPDRRPWIIGGLLALIAVIALLLLLLGGDDDDVASDATTTSSSTSSSTTTSSTTSSSSTSTTAVTTTTTAPTTTTTAAPNPCAEKGDFSTDPELAAQTVYDAWVDDDEQCAAALMTDNAREQLFSRSPDDRDLQSCSEEQSPSPHTDCAFFNLLHPEDGAVHLLMTFESRWQVFQVEFTEG